MVVGIVAGSLVGALILGIAGFVVGARVLDENAGIVAVWFGKVGAAIGAVAGGVLGALIAGR